MLFGENAVGISLSDADSRLPESILPKSPELFSNLDVQAMGAKDEGGTDRRRYAGEGPQGGAGRVAEQGLWCSTGRAGSARVGFPGMTRVRSRREAEEDRPDAERFGGRVLEGEEGERAEIESRSCPRQDQIKTT